MTHENPIWMWEYIWHNAFSMTAAELRDALGVSIGFIQKVCKQLGIKTKPSDHYKINRGIDDLNYITMKPKKQLGESPTALTILTWIRHMSIMGLTVEEIAASLELSTGNVLGKLRFYKLPIRWKQKKDEPYIVKYLKEKGAVMFVQDISRHLHRSNDFVHKRLLEVGLTPKYNNIERTRVAKSKQVIQKEFILANADTMMVEDIAAALGINKYRAAEKIRYYGKMPKWKEIKKTWKPVPIQRSFVKPDTKPLYVRPKPLYTNIPSPLGIATELHKQNRIFI